MDETLARANREAFRAGQFNGLIGRTVRYVHYITKDNVDSPVGFVNGLIVGGPLADNKNGGAYVIIMGEDGNLYPIDVRNCKVIG